MSLSIGRKEDCPWKNSAHCPLGAAQPEERPVLNMRLDAAPAGMIACACVSSHDAGGAPEGTGPVPWEALGPPLYIEAAENRLKRIGPREWGVLQNVLRHPLAGLPALGLQLLPERLQDHLLDAVQAGWETNLRLNLEPLAVAPDRFSVLALRALCQETGTRFLVDEAEPVPSGAASPDGASAALSLVPRKASNVAAASGTGNLVDP